MRIDNSLVNADNDVGYLIWRISKVWQRIKQKTLVDFDLTGPQIEILAAVYHKTVKQAEVSQTILAQKLDMDPMTTSTIVRNLQQKGLISRRESTADSRVRIVELTDKGVDLLTKAIGKMRHEEQRILEAIDQDALKHQLRILLEELNKTNKQEC